MGDGYYQPQQRIPDTPYICGRVLGEGGFGVVYAVIHYWTKIHFALKTLRPSLMDRADLTTRMHEEAIFLGRTRHPNVVAVYDGGVTGDGLPYLVMDLLNGQPLSQALSEMPRGIGLKWTVRLIELFDGLEVVHRKAVHRDIKPSNVFLVADTDAATGRLEWRPVLLDFGISHFMNNKKSITGQMFLGTQKYAAPEQIRGDKPTPKMDLFSMGLVLYECLSGQGPYDYLVTDEAIARAILSREPVPHLSMHMGEIDVRGVDRLVELIMSMLAKDPAARPPSAGWLATALREVRIDLEAQWDAALLARADRDKTDPMAPDERRLITLSTPLSDQRAQEEDPVVVGPVGSEEINPLGATSSAPAGGGQNDTIRDPMPAFGGQRTTVQERIPMGGARTLLPEKRDAEQDRPTAQADSMVDRSAPTPAMDPFRASRPTRGTIEEVLLPAAPVAQPPPALARPLEPPIADPSAVRPGEVAGGQPLALPPPTRRHAAERPTLAFDRAKLEAAAALGLGATPPPRAGAAGEPFELRFVEGHGWQAEPLVFVPGEGWQPQAVVSSAGAVAVGADRASRDEAKPVRQLWLAVLGVCVASALVLVLVASLIVHAIRPAAPRAVASSPTLSASSVPTPPPSAAPRASDRPPAVASSRSLPPAIAADPAPSTAASAPNEPPTVTSASASASIQPANRPPAKQPARRGPTILDEPLFGWGSDPPRRAGEPSASSRPKPPPTKAHKSDVPDLLE
jgi:serine/threonine protein kinase